MQRLAERQSATRRIADIRLNIQVPKHGAVVLPQGLDPDLACMLLKGATATLVGGNDHLHVVFDQHADRSKVDFTEQGFHQTASQQGHTGSGRTPTLH